MDVLRDKAGLSNIRLIILVFVVLSGIAAALLYFPPISTRTAPLKTSGEITFIDGAGNPLGGAISLSGDGVSSGPPKPNVNLISWTQIPNAIINYDAFATKSLSINLRISGDSPKGRVVLENYGINQPGSVNVSAPGTPVKYVEVNSSGVSFADADISIKYTNAEVSGLDVNNLVIYRYDGVLQAWSELPTKIDAINNIVSATVNSLSIFAVSTRVPQDIEIHDTGKMPVISDIKTYDEARTLKKEAKTSKLSSVDVPDRGELEVDALATKNVAVKLKVNVPSKGEVILDDFGKKNPVSVPLPGKVVKFVEIGASGISFSSADITIRYTDADLNGGSEDTLTIYHWNGASWDAVPTVIDTMNKTLSASTTSLSYWGVATSYIYYFENNNTAGNISVGADGRTNYTASGGSFTVRPYNNLLDLGPMGTSVNIGFTTTAGQTLEYELFRFYLPFNYSTDTRISANTTFNLSWQSTTTGFTNNRINVSLINYNPINGAKTLIGNRSFNATAAARTNYSLQINHSIYTVPKGNRLLFRINSTTGTVGTVRLYFNDTASNITVKESTFLSNLSGYVKNASSGATIPGATVWTNTSLTTTTNATGFYNFTVNNGTYLVSASFTNYINNSINVTISGADNTTANISLTPLQTYILSGYVTNATSLAAIPGATVTTNTSQTTSTNATGFYNFTLSNGTYLITASKAGYSDNSTTRTVNGAAVSNVNILLTPTPPTPPVSGKILVATNRFVVLDDDRKPAGAKAGPGFALPLQADYTTWNYWSGINTKINATALFIDNNGFPVKGINITFTLYDPNGTINTTKYDTTNLYGLANFSLDMNSFNFYGKWNVSAANGTLNSGNETFIYNWWGCSYNANQCSFSHSGEVLPAPVTANSPYLGGRDTLTAQRPTHYAAGVNCTFCHQSFDGKPGDTNPPAAGGADANHSNRAADVHRNISCDNPSCHDSLTTHNTNQLIYSCYNSGCHGNASAWDRKDISNKSTLNSGTVSTAVSIYSYNNASTFNATFHNPNSTVPCIICHGPMHNITKPDETQRFTRNNNTEDSQCKTCHSSYTEHNSSNTTSGGVNCTLCHSDDVHDIQVFAQNATYVDLNHDNPNPARGNCTNCHQNATFFVALEKQPKAGNYTGRDPPQVAVPLEHSNDPSAGAKWNQTYWINSNQTTWCNYCHGDTKHSSIALGRPANWDGNNAVNSSLTPGNTTWCAGCHWQGYASGANTYNDMVNAFKGAGLLVPPEISGNATYGANTSIYEYTNHSLYTSFSPNLNDSTCDRCHGYNYPFTTITQLMHNQSRVGGANCADCHDIGGIALLAHVNVTTANDTNAIHKNLNINATHVLNATVYYDNNKRCWACHGNGSEPTTPNAHPTSYKLPDNCTDCHIQSVTQNFNFTPNNTLLNVTEHYWNATNIHTPAVSACYACHNRSEMLIPANDPDAGSGAVYGGANGGNNSTSHYGKKRSDLRAGINTTCSYCHQNASTAFAIAMLDPAYNSSINNHSLNYAASNPACTQCHNTGWIHNSTLIRPILNLPNSSYCLGCHGTGGSATIKNLERHNSTSLTALNCTNCHLNTSRSIHPVRYLQQDGSNFSTLKTNAVNCTTCHQGTGLANFSTAPKIPAPMNHSTNPYNGSLWNGSQQGYWINTSQQSACDYCHNKSALHNASGLGYISIIQGGNTKNQSLSGGYWCANCHYNGSTPSGKYSYKGTQFNPQPPEVNNKSGLVPQSARDGTSFINHSWALTTSYDDARCKACHNNSILDGGISTSLYFSHDVRPGGPDCLACHDITGTGAPPDKKINSTAMLLGVHKNLNKNATNTTILVPLNKACWACHGDGTEPTGHPVNKSNPWSCPDCHNATTKFTSSNATLQNDTTIKKIYNHIPANYTTDIFKISSDVWNLSVNCTACHNKSTVYFNVTFTAVNPLAANVSHYANKSNLIAPTINCTLCHKSPANATEWYANLTRHPAKTQALSFCANCHNTTNATTLHSQPLRIPMVIHGGWGTGGGFDWENDTINLDGAACYACHGAGNLSTINASLQSVKLCENCHVNVSSIFTGPNRTTIYSPLRSDINYTLPYVYSHINYSNITGTNVSVPSQGGTATYPTTCYGYNAVTGEGTCHAAPYFNKSNFGGYYAQYNNGSRPVAKYDPPHWTVPIDRMPNTTNCLFCHNQSNATIRKGWGNATQVNAGNMFGNRYAISNDSCYTCHTRNQSMPVDFHSNEVVTGGGPGCLGCHNNSNRQNYTNLSYIDGTNFSISIHAKINSNNASGYGINASCWACHNSTGTVVPNNTHPDKRDTPYVCTDCHLSSGNNTGAFNATIISNHYRNGTNIRALDNRTSDLVSCIGCHENVSGMRLLNNDTDYGSFASDGVGVKGGNTSFYHYGKNRSNFGKTAGSYDYCIYCHNSNSTGEFNGVFQDVANRSISNHSLRYNSSNPSCSASECHNSTNSSLHGARLIKPNINNTPHNSTYCLGCHGLNVSNGTANYTGAVTTYKEMHNNTVNCTECHTGSNKKNIHPMTYLQPNGTYVTANQTGVNCTNCHQQNTLDSKLIRTPPKVPAPVQHSDNASNGSLWNRTQAGYWTNTSQQSMCDYCHGDSRHNATGLGKPSNWSGSNTMNSSITSNGNWCAGCHYRGYSSDGKNYDNMTLTFTGANRSVSPEITNSSYYSPYNVSGYYNHSLTPDYNDSTCLGCHNKSLTTDTIKDFVHNISTGICTSCHFNYNYMSSRNKPDKYVNSTMFNNSPHGSLACENCHTKGHNNIGARKACEDCHAVVQQIPIPADKRSDYRHNITSIPSTYNYNGTNVLNITDCTVCHDSALYNNATANYGYNKTIDCNYCHTYPDKTYS